MDEPRKQSAAGCLFRDPLGRILIVEPAYKPTWEIPGGQVEVGESPREACLREIREELGLDVAVGSLLAVDYESSRDTYRFLFDGASSTTSTSIASDSIRPSSYRSGSPRSTRLPAC